MQSGTWKFLRVRWQEISHLEKYHGHRPQPPHVFQAMAPDLVLSGVYLMWHFCSDLDMCDPGLDTIDAHISPTLHMFDRWLNFSGNGFFLPQIWFILKWFLSFQVSTSISESLQHKKTWVPKLFWNISHPTQSTCKISKYKFKCIWKLELSSRIRGYQYFDTSKAPDVTVGYLLQKLLLRLQITMPLHINSLHYEYAS